MASKLDRIKQFWVPIERNIPPKTSFLVLCWNAKNGHCSVLEGFIARNHAELILERKSKELSWDRVYTHWMPLVGADGKHCSFYKGRKP